MSVTSISTRTSHPTGVPALVPEWMALLASSEEGDRDYRARVEGTVPSDLRGSLYRNGPGLFEVGGHKVRHLLDGDGLVQKISFEDNGVRYQNAFVETDKRKSEKRANQRLYATWTTRKPGGFLRNLGGHVTESQAGVTVYPAEGKLVARDEVGPNYVLDPHTLERLDTFPCGRNVDKVRFKAHIKLDPDTGEWLLAGQEFGRTMRMHVSILDAQLNLKSQHAMACPRQVYVHDFFASPKYFVFLLHPVELNLFGFLTGLESFTDSMRWRGEEGNVIAVLPRAGGKPTFFEAPGAFMWHSLNAFEQGDDLVADFVGYDEPDHFIGKDAFFYTIMDGHMGQASCPGTIRRYIMNLRTKTLSQEIVEPGNHEFPMLDMRYAMKRHRRGYFACGGLGGFNSGVKRFDFETGEQDVFDFGADTHVGEPVFAPSSGRDLDAGYLIVQCLDGAARKTCFAVLDAGAVSNGPIARIWLSHHVPISFHGAWKAAS